MELLSQPDLMIYTFVYSVSDQVFAGSNLARVSFCRRGLGSFFVFLFFRVSFGKITIKPFNANKEADSNNKYILLDRNMIPTVSHIPPIRTHQLGLRRGRLKCKMPPSWVWS